MASIKPAEVSAILKQQLTNFEAKATLNEVGTVLQVGDGIARVYGLSNVQYGDLNYGTSEMVQVTMQIRYDNASHNAAGDTDTLSGL